MWQYPGNMQSGNFTYVFWDFHPADFDFHLIKDIYFVDMNFIDITPFCRDIST